MQFKEIF